MIWIPVLLSVAIWTWLLVGHGGFWKSEPVLPPPAQTRPLRLTVVIPARNESRHIGEALRSLLLQETDGQLNILVVDDNSTDATASIVKELASGSQRLRLVQGMPLAEGWTGKMWAVAQGLEQPEAQEADYVLLTDADIMHEAGHLQALLSHAERTGSALVSEMVHLRCEDFAERASLPAFVFFFQMLYPFAWVNDPAHHSAAAAGGTILLSREALDRVDGVNAIRSALIDDVALAARVKAAGLRIWLGLGEHVHSRRRYVDLNDIWEMIARTAYVQLDYSPAVLTGTSIGLLLMFVEPVLVTLFAEGWLQLAGAACWLAMALAFWPTLKRYRRSFLWGFALPAIAMFYLAATLDSAWRFRKGEGGQWKERTYSSHR